MTLTRRDFVRQITAVMGAGIATGAGLKILRKDSADALGAVLPLGTPVLVMIELAGGDDMLNTHIPYAHPQASAYYYSSRPYLGIKPITTTRPYVAPATGGSYLPPGLDLDGTYALHGALAWIANRWWTKGDVAIVEGTGEDVRQEMSHFAAMSYRWAGAFTGPNLATGWLGRYNDVTHPGVPLGGISLNGLHQSLFGTLSPAVYINSIGSFNWSVGNIPNVAEWMADFKSMGDTSIPSSYNKIATAAKALSDTNAAITTVQGIPAPANSGQGLAGQLATAAALITGGVSCQTYVATLGGFDTHGSQPYYHFTQLQELDNALSGFFATIDASNRANDVFVLITSEFGRQVTQNGSGGFDHGRASANILIGGGVKGGNYGVLPNLAPAARYYDALVPTIDFRTVWATVLNRLGGDANLTESVMGKDESTNPFADLGVFTTGPGTPPPTGGGGGSTTTTISGDASTTSIMMTTTTTRMPTTTLLETTTTKPSTTTTTMKPTTTTAKPTTTTAKATTTTRPRRRSSTKKKPVRRIS